MRKIVLLLIIGGVVMATLQERIKERRLASGFTLLEVAEMLGVKEATMQRYESGEIKNMKLSLRWLKSSTVHHNI